MSISDQLKSIDPCAPVCPAGWNTWDFICDMQYFVDILFKFKNGLAETTNSFNSFPSNDQHVKLNTIIDKLWKYHTSNIEQNYILVIPI